jgi:hypothetical protein
MMFKYDIVNNADGVNGHYCISRQKQDAEYHEFMCRDGSWASVGDVITCHTDLEAFKFSIDMDAADYKNLRTVVLAVASRLSRDGFKKPVVSQKDPNAGYMLVEPFDIDGTRLDGIQPQVVFCLGYEFCQIRQAIQGDKPFSWTMHANNSERIKAMCVRNKRKFRTAPTEFPAEWVFIDVSDSSGNMPEPMPNP